MALWGRRASRGTARLDRGRNSRRVWQRLERVELDRSNGIESKSPEQVLEQTATALRRVKSFHIESTEGRSESVTGDIAVPKKLRFHLKERDATARMLFIDGALYMKGNAAFWKDSEAGRETQDLADRWIKLPGAVGGLDKLASRSSLRTSAAAC